MTIRVHVLLWFALLASVASRASAQLPPPALPPIAAPSPDEAAPVITPPPTDSAAVTAPSRRDPFWPVGYRPEKPTASPTAPGEQAPATAAPQPTEWERAQKLLKISGISVVPGPKGTASRRYAAIVAGRLVEEGDVVTKTLNGFTYRWRVQSIGPTGVKLQQVDSREP